MGVIFNENGESIINPTNGTFDFIRDDAGLISFVAGDSGVAGGAAMNFGDGVTTQVTLDTEGMDILVDTVANTAIFRAATTQTAIITGADSTGPANTIFDTFETGTITVGSADVASVTLDTVGMDVLLETTADTVIFRAAATAIATITGADAASPADTTFDTTGAGSIIVGSADVLAITLSTDSTGNAEIVLPDDSIGAAELNGANVCGALFHAQVDPTEAGATDDFMSMWDHGGSTTEGNEDLFMANDALLTFHSLACVTATAPGAGDDWVITMRDDGADTAVLCVIDDTNTSCTSTTLSAAVAAGSLLNFDISSDAGASDPTASALITCSVCMGP